MTSYLSGGWYRPGPRGGLRTEVLDGAIDAAGMLHRAGIVPEVVSRLALRVRGLVRMDQRSSFGPDEREIVRRHLDDLTGDTPELVSFVSDCLDAVSSPSELTAFYLHLVHVTRMLELLERAEREPVPAPAPSRATTRRRRRPVGARKAAKRPVRPTSADGPVRRKPKRKAAGGKTRSVRRVTRKPRR